MSETKKYLVIGLAIAVAFIPGCVESNPGTALEIKKFDIQGYEYVRNITTEELNQYPALEKAINGEGCTKYDNYWRCKVTSEEWNRIKDFINSKEIHDRTGRGTCFKIGKKFGEECFTVGFVIP